MTVMGRNRAPHRHLRSQPVTRVAACSGPVDRAGGRPRDGVTLGHAWSLQRGALVRCLSAGRAAVPAPLRVPRLPCRLRCRNGSARGATDDAAASARRRGERSDSDRDPLIADQGTAQNPSADGLFGGRLPAPARRGGAAGATRACDGGEYACWEAVRVGFERRRREARSTVSSSALRTSCT